jgi:hypothetical protein
MRSLATPDRQTKFNGVAGTEAAPLHPWGTATKGASLGHGQAQWNQRTKKEDI